MFNFFWRKKTKHTAELIAELKKLGLNPVSEYWDRHKHIDIAILEAGIYIEVDGNNHYTDSDQIEADFSRTHFSDIDGFNTIHIPNIMIEHHRVAVARAIGKVVNKRLAQNLNSQTNQTV